MEPQTNLPAPEPDGGERKRPLGAGDPTAIESPSRDFSSLILGRDGLRCGWSALLFVGLYYLFLFVFSVVAVSLDPALSRGVFSPGQAIVSELVPLSSILVAGLVMVRIEQRRLVSYNLLDSRKIQHFGVGLLAGFATLSLLIAVLAIGGWLHFGSSDLRGLPILQYAVLWACAFLLVALFEEGFFRCYLLSTLTRGIGFWWALATVAALCLLLETEHGVKGANGVYAIALIGVIPCWLAHRSRAGSSSFWQAAWATSTAFSFFHTNNGGENAVGIFAAGLVGFVFCVSVKVTGSAWWAIGCHAAWDWAETFFYGTFDSGFAPLHHLLTSTPAGDALLSGGSDGPEGSLLVIPVLMLLTLAILVLYRSKTFPVSNHLTDKVTLRA